VHYDPRPYASFGSKARHFLGLISEQSKYNLVTRDLERELLLAVAGYGIGVMVWSPLQRGLLGGSSPLRMKAGYAGTESTPRLAKYRPQLTRYEALCAELVVPPAHVALA
jgi:NDP-hexose C3-ketoreductase / dTDP-4-oxo-2-deoxy-alpha-D-pentos-2-ene 2,3-reductase